MTPYDLDLKIAALLDLQLNLEDGEMLMPLKRHEIAGLHNAIRQLVEDAAREVTV